MSHTAYLSCIESEIWLQQLNPSNYSATEYQSSETEYSPSTARNFEVQKILGIADKSLATGFSSSIEYIFHTG